MDKAGALTRVLVLLGTSLVWFPLWAAILFSLYFFVLESRLHLDYLIPAELFPFALAGGALLLWAAVRARRRLRLISWGAGIAAGSLVAVQVLATATGLASGAAEPTGWRVALAQVFLGAYALALAATGTGGILLLRDVIRSGNKRAEDA